MALPHAVVTRPFQLVQPRVDPSSDCVPASARSCQHGGRREVGVMLSIPSHLLHKGRGRTTNETGR